MYIYICSSLSIAAVVVFSFRPEFKTLVYPRLYLTSSISLFSVQKRIDIHIYFVVTCGAAVQSLGITKYFESQTTAIKFFKSVLYVTIFYLNFYDVVVIRKRSGTGGMIHLI